ncbi:MAG: nucleotidyltransferase [bacterium]
MATIRLHPDFREFLKLLNAARVDYLLIGGYAVGYYGYSRTTLDMDVWIAVRADNAKKMANVMVRFGFPKKSVAESVFMEKGKVLRMGLPPVRLEILTDISGVTFDDCYDRRNRVTVDGIQVNLIGFEDLLRNKASSGRHKDLDDLEHLRP